MKKLSALALALCVSVPAFANDDVDDDVAAGPRFAQAERGRGGRGDHDGRGAEVRERVKQKIQTYVTAELAARAGLDEKKSLQLGEAIKAHMERKHAARQKKRAEHEKLKSLVDGKGGDAAVKAQLATLLQSDGREEQLQAFVDDTGRFLTPKEQAKIVLALPEVMKDTRALVREARSKRGGGEAGGRFRERR